MGAYAKAAVEALQSPLIKEVRGVGLMLAIELAADFSQRIGDERPAAQALIARLQEKGLLCIPAGTQNVRLLPPLNVTKAEIDQAVEIIRSALK